MRGIWKRHEILLLSRFQLASTQKMEPFSVALGVVSVFKDAYLTAKFIRNTIQSIKGYEAEQSQLVTRYNVQIYRLKNLSRLFRAADDNLVDMKLLKTVPDVRHRNFEISCTSLNNSRNISTP